MCGECNACCTYLRIAKDELSWRDTDKEKNEICDKLTRGCCGIYEERPKPCRDYECLWLFLFKKKKIDLKYRPDKAGFMVTASKNTISNDDGINFKIQEIQKESLVVGGCILDNEFMDEIFKLKGLKDIITISPYGHENYFEIKKGE